MFQAWGRDLLVSPNEVWDRPQVDLPPAREMSWVRCNVDWVATKGEPGKPIPS